MFLSSSKKVSRLFEEVEQCINCCGGLIYGKYVEDILIIEKNTFKYFSNSEILEKRLDERLDGFYNNEILPSLHKRTMLPIAIDCIMNKNQFASFTEILNGKKLVMAECTNKLSEDLFDVPVMNKSFFIKYDLNDLIRYIAPWNIQINIVIFDGVTPPVPKSDTYPLVLQNKQVSINADLCKDMTILDQIAKLNTILEII